MYRHSKKKSTYNDKKQFSTNSRNMRQHALMSFSTPFYFLFLIYNLFHVMHDILAIFYIHIYFIEGNERFKLGGEDLEKLKNSKFSKFFNFLLF